MDAPVKITIHDPKIGDRVGIMFITGLNDGWGIMCDDGSYVYIDTYDPKLKDVTCIEIRQSFINRGMLCISRKSHRPIYEECKMVNQLKSG